MLAAMLLLAGLVTAACGTGHVAQTAEQVTPWARGEVGEIAVLDVAFPFRPPVAGDEVYRVGRSPDLSGGLRFERGGDVFIEVPVDLPHFPRRAPVEGS